MFTDIHSHVLPGVDDGAQSYEEAVKICDEVIRRNRFFPESRYHKALALVELGREKEAIEEMELLEDCDFGYMTTVTDEEIDELREKLGMEEI